MEKDNDKGHIGQYEIKRANAISSIKTAIEKNNSVLASLSSEHDNIKAKVLSMPFVISIENVSVAAVRYAELLDKKKKVDDNLDQLGIMIGTSKLNLLFIKVCITILIVGGVLYRMMGDRSLAENVPKLLELTGFEFTPLSNALLIEGICTAIAFFFLFHHFGDNYKKDNRKIFLRFTIISGALTLLLFVGYALLY
ncbi:MAG: hypothetical protein HZA00_08470 [Nitrospinae bacterium]|nr:hypothetical protein [Nitrospinota bacterium]